MTAISNHQASIFKTSALVADLVALAGQVQLGLNHLALTPPEAPAENVDVMVAVPAYDVDLGDDDLYSAAARGWGITREEAKLRIYRIGYGITNINLKVPSAPASFAGATVVDDNTDGTVQRAILSPEQVAENAAREAREKMPSQPIINSAKKPAKQTPGLTDALKQTTSAKKPVTKTIASADLDKQLETTEQPVSSLVIPQSDLDLLAPYVDKVLGAGTPSVTALLAKTWDFIKRKPRPAVESFSGKTQQEWNNWLSTALPVGTTRSVGHASLKIAANGSLLVG